jgi:hypothetical protein
MRIKRESIINKRIKKRKGKKKKKLLYLFTLSISVMLGGDTSNVTLFVLTLSSSSITSLSTYVTSEITS